MNILACVFMYRLEVGIGYLSQSLSTLFFRRDLSEPGAHQFGNASWPESPRVTLVFASSTLEL